MLIIGLGNPEYRYKFSRHNIGFLIIEEIAEENGCKFYKKNSFALIAKWEQWNKDILLVKPTLYMNNSGIVVKKLVEEYNRPFLIVTDDVDLPFGRLCIKNKGGAGGHKGMESIIATLGTQEFPRLRVGMGPRPPGNLLTDYVLSPIEKEELKELPNIIEKAKDAICTIIKEGIEIAMNRFNPW